MKHQQLLKDVKSGVLGKYKSHVCTIEFQKRGLPHCHYLFIMEGDKPTPHDIDDVISAELPDPATCPQLHDIVRRWAHT